MTGCFAATGQSDDLNAVTTAGLWSAGLPAAAVGAGKWRYEVVVAHRGLSEGPLYNAATGELMVQGGMDKLTSDKDVRELLVELSVGWSTDDDVIDAFRDHKSALFGEHAAVKSGVLLGRDGQVRREPQS